MRKFGGLTPGKSPLRQRQQTKPPLTSLASLAEMVDQANTTSYSNIRLCLNSEKPQLEVEQFQQPFSKNIRDKSPLRGALNKENDLLQFGNKNAFEGNRFAECLIKDRVKEEGSYKNNPVIGNLISKNRQDVSPGRQRPRQLNEGDFVFRANAPNTSRGINFSQISRKFNEQQSEDSELLSYAPSIEDSRPKSRTKAPRLQKQFDEDDFGDIRESIKDQENFHKPMMNTGQRQRFQSKIEEIKDEKIKLLKDKRSNKTLLPKIIEDIKSNATKEIEEFAMNLFNQSKKEDDEYLLDSEPQSNRRMEESKHQRETKEIKQKRSFEERVEEKRVIIGVPKAHVIKPIETFIGKVNNSSEEWRENQMPMVESEYPLDCPESKTKIGQPSLIRIEPQPTRFVRGLDLEASKDAVATSIKEIGEEFSKRQDELVLELQRKRSEDERIERQREEEEREKLKKEELLREMEAKRKRFEEEARLRKEEGLRLEQERIHREQQRQRIQNQERIQRQLELERADKERKYQEELKAQRVEQERIRVQQVERERRIEEDRVEKQRRLKEEVETERMRVQLEIKEIEERQRQESLRVQEFERQRQLEMAERLRKEDERARLEEERIQREKEEAEEEERLRIEGETLRQENERMEQERRERERLQFQRVRQEEREIEEAREREIEEERKQQMQRIERERLEREIFEREQREREEREERERLAQRQRLEEERVRLEEEERRLKLARLQREQEQFQERERRDAELRQREEEDKARVIIAELEEARIKEEALKQAQRLQAIKYQQEREAEMVTPPPSVMTSFKFDLGGDDLKTSFKFDNLFTGFSLGIPAAEQKEAITTTSFTKQSIPTTLDQLVKNQDMKQSYTIPVETGMDFKFDLGLDLDVSASQKFN